MSSSPQITLYSRLVLLTKTRHTFRHSFYHQILVLACQRLVLVTEKRFVDDYFSSSSSLTKLTLHHCRVILMQLYKINKHAEK